MLLFIVGFITAEVLQMIIDVSAVCGSPTSFVSVRKRNDPMNK